LVRGALVVVGVHEPAAARSLWVTTRVMVEEEWLLVLLLKTVMNVVGIEIHRREEVQG
jgi:hypothetical protein